MNEPITRELAEATLAAVREQFADYLEGIDPNDQKRQPWLYEPGFHCNGWAIAWEGVGPRDWADYACRDTVDTRAMNAHIQAGVPVEDAIERATVTKRSAPAGVHVEPVLGCILGLYPDIPVVFPPHMLKIGPLPALPEHLLAANAARKARMIEQIMSEPFDPDTDGEPLTYAEIKALGGDSA